MSTERERYDEWRDKQRKDIVCNVRDPQPAEHVIEIRTPQPYYLLQYPSNDPKVGQIMVPCGNPQKDANGGTIQQYCWVYPNSKRRERGQ